ncbi:MAG TPA: CHAT domain-containing tetratricopeptide repeat protein [Dokdonella sp.]|nr:CHAT domain-containing tetratricopeptide repeat protein [Dokdonella sp.]
MAADRAVDLLEQGACNAAQRAAADEFAAVEAARADGTVADGTVADGALADALAVGARVALDCERPDTPGLEQWLAREVALRTQADGADAASVAAVKLQQARHAQQANRLDDALAATRALDARADALAWPAGLRARIANQLATLHNLRADAAAALEASDRAIATARAAHDDATLLLALENRALALTRQRRGSDALVPTREALALAHAKGEHSRELAVALGVAARAQREAGDHGAAIDSLEQSLAIRRALAEPDQRAIADTLLALGQTLKISGDSERAAPVYERALAADRLGPDPLRRTRPAILHGLANLERDRGHNERALELYAEAVPLFEQAYGAQSPQLAQVLNNNANAHANLGHYDAANALYRRAVNIARARDSSDPADYLPLGNGAMIDVWQGRYAQAEGAFRELVERQRHVDAGSESSTLFSHMGLAASLWGQRRMDEAFDVAVEAEHLRQSALRLAASHLGERQAVNLQEYQRPTMDLVVSIAVAGGTPSQLERAWELGMAARDQVTAIRAQRLAAARATTDPRLAALWRQWRETSAALAQAELAHAPAARRREAQARVDRAERALATATPLGTSLASVPIAFDRVRRHLPADASLVLFATSHLRAASDFAKDEAERRPPQLYAFVLPGPRAKVRTVDFGSLEPVARAVDAWTAAMADRDVALATVGERGRVVRESLWRPLVQSGAGNHWLVLPTAASLYRMPWAALPDGDGYLADRGFRAHVLNHERELSLSSPASGAPRLLAVADPAIGHGPVDARGCPRALPALPGARREGAALDALWHARFGAAAASTVLVGADATESRVRAAAAGADVIHFGTHGISVGDDCGAPADALAATRGFSIAADTPLDDRVSALVPAALLLAPGAGHDSDDDGVLGMEEIAALDLSRTRWAVLAACATAAGSTHRYEGLFGLARAFRLAGARTVLTSLWPVDDAATAEWTQALYAARFDRGLDTAAALAAAQRDILAARRARSDSTHPYYWAAFVATGDWR